MGTKGYRGAPHCAVCAEACVSGVQVVGLVEQRSAPCFAYLVCQPPCHAVMSPSGTARAGRAPSSKCGQRSPGLLCCLAALRHCQYPCTLCAETRGMHCHRCTGLRQPAAHYTLINAHERLHVCRINTGSETYWFRKVRTLQGAIAHLAYTQLCALAA